MSNKDSPPIQAFDQLKLEHNDLEKFKQKFQKQYGLANKYGEYYIGHSEIQLLFCFLFFALANDKVMLQQRSKIMMKELFQREDFEESEQFKLIRDKFYLGWENGKSLIKLLKERRNMIISNEQLLLQQCEKSSINEWIILFRTIFRSISKYINFKITGKLHQNMNFSNKSKIYLTILFTYPKSYLICYQQLPKYSVSQEKVNFEEKKRQIFYPFTEKRQNLAMIGMRDSKYNSKIEYIPIDDQNGRKSIKIKKPQSIQEVIKSQIQQKNPKQKKKSSKIWKFMSKIKTMNQQKYRNNLINLYRTDIIEEIKKQDSKSRSQL